MSTGFQMFEDELNKAKKDWAGELSEFEIEAQRVRARDLEGMRKRERILNTKQNSTIIQMIVGKFDTLFLSNLRSASKIFKWGSD